MGALYPATDGGSLVHLVVDPNLTTRSLCNQSMLRSQQVLDPIHMPSLCGVCQKVAEAQGLLTRCVGCLRLVAKPSDHAQGCPTGQNGSPNYD